MVFLIINGCLVKILKILVLNQGNYIETRSANCKCCVITIIPKYYSCYNLTYTIFQSNKVLITYILKY